ncbi:MAG: tetratricopeptide repeat protein, partial [Anaerolineae bacterium]|nr:tetratricopeptide repeat protein [Anaerolineae bacterium]
MGKPLIVTKYVIPGRRADLLRRPRLLDFMHEHVDRKLVLVSAPAGYGKTSLLVEFAHDTDLPVCWYSLDTADRDPRVFAEYLLAAIRHRFPQFGPDALALLESSERLSDSEALVAVLVNEIYQEIPDYFVLVLDDYHLVNPSEPVNYLLDSLLQRLPENCHLIIASRTIPTLTPRGLALLTARQEVAGLGVRELRFTPQEIQELVLQNYHQVLPDETAQELARQSEGWITGILLSAQATWKDLLAGVARLRGTGLSVYDYLASEVFAQQGPEVQRFLLASSVLDEMNARRCNALLGIDNAAAILDLLEEGNVFIVRFEKEQERWYRYHALFQGFLRQKLASEAPEQATALHLRAADILEEEGEWDAAFRHRMAAGDLHGAVAVVLQAAQEMYEAGRLETLAQWIDQIPEHALADVPRLIWYRGRVHAETGEWARALELYDRARQGFEQRGEAEAAAQTLVDAGVSLRFLGRPQEAIQAGEQALERLAQAGARTSLIAAGARRNLGICLHQMGRPAEGIEHLREALRLYTEGDSSYGRALTHGDLGAALALAGNLAAAELHNQEALRLWQEMGHSANMANVLNTLAVGQQWRGEYEAALANLERALDCAQRAGSRRLQALLLAGKGDVFRERGEWEQAVAAYEEARSLAESVRYPSLLRHLLNATAEVHRARGEYPQALALARRAYDQAAEQGLAQDAARCGITLAAIYLEQGNPSLAEEYLRRAVQTLSSSRAGSELALAWLQLARVAHARADVQARQECIQRMAEVTMELGYDHFLANEVARALPVVEPVMQSGVGGDVLADLVRRARLSVEPSRLQMAAPAGEPPRVQLRIQALGACTVYANDRQLTAADWGTARAKELFFYILSFPSRRREQIAEVLWPDLSAGRLRSAFHVTLYRVRRALGVSDCVLYDNEQYFFNRQLDYWYDVEEFE